ncbi:MAG TPA: IclR family transcriptional regulator [Desulfomonilia bacterium]|nr:IclR family transcriptional regulator [Desulfomonilia bacterium]
MDALQSRKMKQDKRLIQSIKRASDILSLFIDEKKPIGITEFSRRLGLAKTTIAGIVSTLEAIGWLEKDPFTPKYRLGPQLFQLGMKCATNMDLVTIARAWMERLCFQFMEPVNVGMLVGDKVMIVMRIEPENRYMVFPQAGSIIPMHSTCIGKLLFAFMDKERRDLLLADYRFEGLTTNTITSHKRFAEELDQIRISGVSFDNQESINGLAGIGGPIFNHAGVIIAAFAITGNPATIGNRRSDIIEAVKFTSHQISAQLGYSQGGLS